MWCIWLNLYLGFCAGKMPFYPTVHWAKTERRIHTPRRTNYTPRIPRIPKYVWMSVCNSWTVARARLSEIKILCAICVYMHKYFGYQQFTILAAIARQIWQLQWYVSRMRWGKMHKACATKWWTEQQVHSNYLQHHSRCVTNASDCMWLHGITQHF